MIFISGYFFTRGIKKYPIFFFFAGYIASNEGELLPRTTVALSIEARNKAASRRGNAGTGLVYNRRRVRRQRL